MNTGTMLILAALALSAVSLYFHAKGIAGSHLSKLAARKIFYASALVTGIAGAMLLAAFMFNSFQYYYVYSFSSRDLPFLYRVAAFWAGQEGTFLLWAALLYVFGFIIIRFRDENESIIMSVITITQIFLLVLLVLHSPFRYVWHADPAGFPAGVVPPDGAGLNPLLQDFWMIIHPPVLFIGYAAAVVPFAFAIAALMKGDYNQLVFKAYRWVLFTVVMLGIGIFLGGYWAYKVLGWGGYWGWDPVENSSLIPWLTLIALMHGLIIQRRKNALVRTNLFLALVSFVLVFYSTFLTRSGVLSNFSVHSFSDLGFSRHLVFFMVFYAAIAGFLFAKRFRAIQGGRLSESLISWDTLTAYGIITMCVFALLVLIGTSMPIISSAVSPDPFSVQLGFYSGITVPLGLIIVSCIAAAGFFQGSGKARVLPVIAAAAASIAGGVLFNFNHTAEPAAYVFAAVSFFILIMNLKDLFKFNFMAVLASRISHMGVALLVLGVISSSYHSSSEQKRIAAGARENLGLVGLVFKGITTEEKSALLFDYSKGARKHEIRVPYYISRKSGSLYREPYIDYGAYGDVYISPIEYRSGIESLTRFELARGEEKTLGRLAVTFIGFDMDRRQMLSGEAKLLARLQVKHNGGSYLLAPGIQFTRGDERIQLDATVPSTGQRVSLLDFNVSAGSVLVYLQPQAGAQVPPDSVIVEVSFKRLIALVWLGTVLIAAGIFIAMRKK